MSSTSPALPKASLILVTGANGFIASHVVDQILLAGYKVRGTVRTLEKGKWLQDIMEERYGKDVFELAKVEDMSIEGAWNEAIESCAGVVHLASDVSFSPDPNQVIPHLLKAIEELLKAAANASIKRFVYTSSSAAATLPKPNVKFHIDSSSFNNESVQAAWAPPPYENDRAFTVYAASKTQAEQTAWKFVKEHKPGFVLNTVLPNLSIGTIMSDKQSGSTAGWLRDCYTGKDVDTLPNFPPQYWVNVDDVARLHLAALVEEDVKSERLFGFAGPYDINNWWREFRKISPEKKFPEDVKDPERDLSTVDTTRSVELLKRQGRDGWTSLEESIRQNVAGAESIREDIAEA